MHKTKYSYTQQEKQGSISYTNPCLQDSTFNWGNEMHTCVCVIKQDAYMKSVVGWHITKSQ